MTTANAFKAVDAAPVAVEKANIQVALQGLEQQVTDPNKGLFGPGSMFWEVNRHTLVYFLGAVQSVQMQLCHPWIAKAVFEHSKIMSDPRRRAQLTYIYLWSIIYGDMETVSKKAKALFNVHERVSGVIGEAVGRHQETDKYQANEYSALLWVHVTAFYCRLKLYEQLIQPLTPVQRDQFCQEATRYAQCFGIPEEAHPKTWQDVENYVEAMAASNTLARTEAGLKIRHFLEANIPAPLRGTLWNYLCAPLPERMQALLDQPMATPQNLMRSRRIGWMLKQFNRILPERIAFVPAYHEAMQRIDGKSEPDWLTAKLNSIFLGTSKLVS